MKAVRIHQFGGPEVMKVEEIERPVPEPDEILVAVYASGVNPVDFVVRAGKSAAMNYNLTLPMTLGWDVAGIVEDWGTEVTGFRKGDAVYGVPNFPGDGSYAEYCVVKASQLALKPQSLSFTAAAGVPLVALTAWTGMFEYGKLQAGQVLLIQGASGGVGSSAVQFAKAKGAYVIGIDTASNFDYLKSLGINELMDHKTQRFEDLVQDVDVVLEASSVRDNNERLRSVKVLKKGGIFVSVNTDFPFNDQVVQALAEKDAKGELSPNQPRREWLTEIAQLIDSGKVKINISKVYQMSQASEAHFASESRLARGKLVLEIRK